MISGNQTCVEVCEKKIISDNCNAVIIVFFIALFVIITVIGNMYYRFNTRKFFSEGLIILFVTAFIYRSRVEFIILSSCVLYRIITSYQPINQQPRNEPALLIQQDDDF